MACAFQVDYPWISQWLHIHWSQQHINDSILSVSVVDNVRLFKLLILLLFQTLIPIYDIVVLYVLLVTIMTLYISPSILLGMIIFDIVFDEIFYCVLILPYYLLSQQDFHFEMNFRLFDILPKGKLRKICSRALIEITKERESWNLVQCLCGETSSTCIVGQEL